MLHLMIDKSHALLPSLIQDIEKESPDLILYDSFFTPSKYLLEVIKARQRNRTLKVKAPKTVMFAAQFPVNERLVKSIRENAKETIWTIFSLISAFKDQFWLSWTFGMSVYNPLKLLKSTNDQLNVVGVTRELQPYVDEFDNTFKFVGSCIAEDVRSIEIYKDDTELESFLNQFEVKQVGSSNTSDLKLIYMSLGTIFNANLFIFETVIEAIKNFDQKPGRVFKSSQFKVVISVGDLSFKQLNEKIATGELILPGNILIRPKVPQLELLKRADLFITHCGMNSTNEAIKYAVPIIGIPLEADQPMVAKRACDELSLGIRFDPLKLDTDEIATAIDRILSEDIFKKNITDLSLISAKYNGPVESAKIVMDYLNK
jgi:hypothetical protein